MSKRRREVVHVELLGSVFPEGPQLPPALAKRLRTPIRIDHFVTVEASVKASAEALARYRDLLDACGISLAGLGENLMPLLKLLALSYPGLRVERPAWKSGAKPSLDAVDVYTLIGRMGLEEEKGAKRYESRVCREFAKERGLNEKTVRDIWNEVKCVGKAEADPDNLTSIQRVYVLVVEPLSHEKEAVSPKELMERYRRRFVVAAHIKSANLGCKAVDQR